VATKFETLDDLVRSLRSRGIDQVRLIGKVATATSPGGAQITFRGRLKITADLGHGEHAEYEEHVSRYVTETKAPDLPATPKRALDLRSAQTALVQQLQVYRSDYQAVMQAARSDLTDRLERIGIAVIETEG
jgi:isoaspartyl peptidase/L-asparaginase-like protein (Ntn-hydrolase superfamily)